MQAIFIVMLFLVVSCDTFKMRRPGSCLKSISHGNHLYKVVEDDGNFILLKSLDGKNPDIERLPNDNSWSNAKCPF